MHMHIRCIIGAFWHMIGKGLGIRVRVRSRWTLWCLGFNILHFVECRMQNAKVLLAKFWVQHAKCMSFVDLGWTCDLWFFVTKFECEVSSMFLSFSHSLFLFYSCFKCSSSTMHHSYNVFYEARVWAWFEVWTTNTLHQHPKPL
jgi:hypothetical protein